MRYARIYPWRRTRRSRAPSNQSEAFFVAQFSAGYTTNMFGFDLRQGQDANAALVAQYKLLDARWHLTQLQIAAPAHFLGNVGRDVTRPAFGGVETDDA